MAGLQLACLPHFVTGRVVHCEHVAGKGVLRNIKTLKWDISDRTSHDLGNFPPSDVDDFQK